MQKVITFLLLLFYSPAFAQNNCADFFKKNVVANINETSLTLESLSIHQKFSFRDLGIEGQIKTTTLGTDGKQIAVVSRIENFNGDLDQPRQQLHLIDVETQKVILQETFREIKKVFFMPEQNAIAIDGTRPSDGKVAKLFMIKAGPPPLEKSQTHTLVEQTSFQLPGSPYWGVGVTQVLTRPDLLSIIVIQDSANPLKTIYRENTPSMVDPNTSLLNQGMYVFGSYSLELKATPTFSGLHPISAAINPNSSLLALTVVNPIVAEKGNHSIVIVDAQNPERALYTYNFGGSSMTLPMGPNADMSVSYNITTQWSPAGEKLAIVEQSTGSVIVYNSKTKEQWESRRNADNYWPIRGSQMLNDGNLLLVRQGIKPHTESRAHHTDLFIYLASTTTAIREDLVPRFSLQLAGSPKNSKTPIKIQNIFEMQDGKILAFILKDQIIFVDRINPRRQVSLAPGTRIPLEWWQSSDPVSSVQKVSESTLRISDHEQGVFDISVPNF